MHRVTVKTSTIFIAKGGKTKVYRSVQEMPHRLRQELEQSTNGFNSATILIAGRSGTSPAAKRTASVGAVVRFMRRNWLEIVLPAAVGGILWLAFNYH